MPPYCTPEQAGQWLGPGNGEDPYRDLASVDPDTDTLELGAHHLKTGDMFEVTAKAGTVAGGLALKVEYYAIVVNRSQWKAAATLADALAGIAIDITDEGDNMGVILHIPWDRIIAEEGALVDDMITGSGLPLPDGATVPPLVSRFTSVLVAGRVSTFTGETTGDLEAHRADAQRLMETYYLKGKPLRNEPPPATNTAVRTPRMSGSASSAWSRGDTLP